MSHKALSFKDIEDLIAAAIAEAVEDSMDIDWTPVQGARSVVRELRRQNLLRGVAVPDAAMEATLDDVFRVALRRGL
jgi:hypothetical protein